MKIVTLLLSSVLLLTSFKTISCDAHNSLTIGLSTQAGALQTLANIVQARGDGTIPYIQTHEGSALSQEKVKLQLSERLQGQALNFDISLLQVIEGRNFHLAANSNQIHSHSDSYSHSHAHSKEFNGENKIHTKPTDKNESESASVVIITELDVLYSIYLNKLSLELALAQRLIYIDGQQQDIDKVTSWLAQLAD